MKKTIIITGVSRGIGFELAKQLSDAFHVIGTFRKENQSIKLLRMRGVQLVKLEMNEKQSILKAGNQINSLLAGERFYALINNIGIVEPAAILTTDVAILEKQFQVNVFGCYQLTQALLPNIESPGGRIINIGSVSAKFIQPFLAPYCASKAALFCLTKAWRMELNHLGVQVTQINLGNVKTGLRNHSIKKLKGILKPLGGFERIWPIFQKNIISRGNNGMNVKEASIHINRILRKSKLKPQYILGFDAKVLIFIKCLMPNNWLEQIMQKKSGLKSLETHN